MLTAPHLLDVVDQQLPVHRERLLPPTATLSLFMAQTLNADASCQATMDRHVVERITNNLSPCSTATGAYCKARQRLPLTTVRSLLQHTGHWLMGLSATAWRWQGRTVKLVDGATVTVPDTVDNQWRHLQSHTRKSGLGSLSLGWSSCCAWARAQSNGTWLIKLNQSKGYMAIK